MTGLHWAAIGLALLAGALITVLMVRAVLREDPHLSGRPDDFAEFDLFLDDLERRAAQQLNTARDAYPPARDANGRTAAEEAQDHAHWGSGEWDQVIPGQRRSTDIEETP